MWLDFWMEHYSRQVEKGGIDIEAEDDEFDPDTALDRIRELNARRGGVPVPDPDPPVDDDWETLIDYQNPDQR